MWFHSFKFDDGEIINGITTFVIQDIILAHLKNAIDFNGKTVLDVGCWDGYYSIEASKAGASSVLGIDVVPKNRPFVPVEIDREWQKHFDYALSKNKCDNVSYKNLDLFDLDNEQYDIVLFMGVLYHLKHPLLALEKLRKCTKEFIVLETHVACEDIELPTMRFYPGNELADDHTNWWGPNPICVHKMLEVAGFSVISASEYWSGRRLFIAKSSKPYGL